MLLLLDSLEGATELARVSPAGGSRGHFDTCVIRQLQAPPTPVSVLPEVPEQRVSILEIDRPCDM